MLRATPNCTRVYRGLCYAYGVNIKLKFNNIPNWLASDDHVVFEDDQQQHPPNISLVVIPRHCDVRNWDGLQECIRGVWKPGGNVVMWQYNGVFFYASLDCASGTIRMSTPVGKMSNSVDRLFDRILEIDEKSKRKRLFTRMSQTHIDKDLENDIV